MGQSKISLCYYPTMAIVIDDNKEFLKHLSLRLVDREHLLCKFFTDPKSSLHFLNNEYQADSFINRCVVSSEGEDVHQVVLNFDIRMLYLEIYNPLRFSEISTLIVDYAMPSMNGLEFCRKIKEPGIKKMMLTGEAGKDLAVEAFNEGSIDKFIMKNMPQLMDVLIENINNLQSKYFFNLSNTLLTQITSKQANSLSCLNDAAFVALFNNLVTSNNIVEYYLLDEQGSFLMLDMDAKPHWLIVKDEKEMQSLSSYAEISEAPSNILNSLSTKKKIPFFLTDEDLKTSPKNWGKYMWDATLLKGNEARYYAFVADNEVYQLKQDQILSYEKFLEGL